MRPHIWLVCIKCNIIRRINMSACSVLARTHCCCFPKVGTRHKSCDNWGMTRDLQGGHWSLLSPQTMPAILSPMMGGCDDRLSCYELERGSIFITGLMTWRGWDLIQSTATVISLLAASFTAEPINSGTGAWRRSLVLIKDWSCMLIYGPETLRAC